MSKETDSASHANFLANYQAFVPLNQNQDPQNNPPMTYWQNARGQIVAVALHGPGNRFFYSPQYDNKTQNAGADTLLDQAMKSAVGAVAASVASRKGA